MLRASPVHPQPVPPGEQTAAPAPRRAVLSRGGSTAATRLEPVPPPGYGPPPNMTLDSEAVLVPRPAQRSAAPDDYQTANLIKRKVSDELAKAVNLDPTMSDADREQRARALINNSVATWVVARAQEMGEAPASEVQRAMESLVFDLLFRAGRLQPYLDDNDVENILINGYDGVVVDYASRGKVEVGPIAESDEDLVLLLQDLARRSGHGERTLSTSAPILALRLPDGSRLQAMTEVVPRPNVTIRRHGVRATDLAGMVALGTIDSTLAAYLAALVHARKNILISGGQGVGKTSLLRALAREIPLDERIGTLETEYELYLHELDQGRQVVAMEAREGNGERVDGQAAGEITVNDLIYPALRMSLARMVVGEVRGPEVVPMLKSMTSGEGGTLCTIHAREAGMVFDRITELYLEAGGGRSEQLAYRQIANGVDAVVHLRIVDEQRLGGGRHRFVSHVLEVTGIGENGRPATNTIFGPRPEYGEQRAVPLMNPSCLDDLVRVGFDSNLLLSPGGSWQAPLDLKVGS